LERSPRRRAAAPSPSPARASRTAQQCVKAHRAMVLGTAQPQPVRDAPCGSSSRAASGASAFTERRSGLLASQQPANIRIVRANDNNAIRRSAPPSLYRPPELRRVIWARDQRQPARKRTIMKQTVLCRTKGPRLASSTGQASGIIDAERSMPLQKNARESRSRSGNILAGGSRRPPPPRTSGHCAPQRVVQSADGDRALAIKQQRHAANPLLPVRRTFVAPIFPDPIRLYTHVPRAGRNTRNVNRAEEIADPARRSAGHRFASGPLFLQGLCCLSCMYGLSRLHPRYIKKGSDLFIRGFPGAVLASMTASRIESMLQPGVSISNRFLKLI